MSSEPVISAERRPLGDSGLEVSVAALGCNNLGRRIDADQTQRVVDAALEQGITFFDTADMYGGGASERVLGAALGDRRADVVIATKFGHPRGPDFGVPKGSAEHVRRATEESLERLATDYIDLQYLHSPDPDTPIEVTLEALWTLIDEGKVRAIACSNFSAVQLEEAEQVARSAGKPHFSAVQNKYNIIERGGGRDVLPLCREYGIGFVPWFPLASGLLTGKYTRGAKPPAGSRFETWGTEVSDEQWDAAERADAFAQELGWTLHELALGGLASEPGITSVIAGATSPEQLSANVAATAKRLDEGQLERLAAAIG